MFELHRRIEEVGGVIATWELHELGFGRRGIERLLEAGAVDRVRQGWYCNPWLEESARQAARVGGQLGCCSAAAFWRLWVPTMPDVLHVSVDPNACQLRERTDHRKRRSESDETVRVHWAGRDLSQSRVAVPPLVALEQICFCQPAEFALVAVESALNRGVIGASEWKGVLDRLPQDRGRLLAHASGLSGSGIETMFTNRIRRLGLTVRQQVFISGVGYVDAIIGERLVIELDSELYHQDQARDRRRDAVASIEGFRSLRFLANQVTREWQVVEDAVMAAVSRGDHLPA
jgi:very-short-patch-repair endonuclease